MASYCKDTLPASNWVGANDGVNGFEDGTNVLGGTTWLAVELKAVVLSSLVEARLGVGSCE
jgi:hypothetical protein